MEKNQRRARAGVDEGDLGIGHRQTPAWMGVGGGDVGWFHGVLASLARYYPLRRERGKSIAAVPECQGSIAPGR